MPTWLINESLYDNRELRDMASSSQSAQNRDILNTHTRHMYHLYIQLRYALSGSHCKRKRIDTIITMYREQAHQPHMVAWRMKHGLHDDKVWAMLSWMRDFVKVL